MDEEENLLDVIFAILFFIFMGYIIIHPEWLETISDWLREHLHIQEILNCIE